MNNSFKHSNNKYTVDLERMVELVERDHGGCDDNECSIANLLNNYDSSMEEIVHWWACSGAADKEFNDLYTLHESAIREVIK